MASELEIKLRSFPTLYITDSDIRYLLSGSPDRRHSQVKRALARGLLIPIRRGLYCLADYLAPHKPQPFELSHYLYQPSYVSLESALSYHNLIPEAVYSTTCVSTKRAKAFSTPYGEFVYFPLPRNNFYLSVTRIHEGHTTFLIADPWKAICDFVYCYKKNWSDLTPLYESLRIEHEDLPKLKKTVRIVLGSYYNSRRVSKFLTAIPSELLK